MIGKKTIDESMLRNKISSISKLKDEIEKCSKPLTLPNLPESLLLIEYSKDRPEHVFFPWSGNLPFADSEIVHVKLAKSRRLTKEDPQVKKTMEFTFEFSDEIIPFEPGDSLGFLCRNPLSEVECLLKRTGSLDHADLSCEIKLNSNVNQKKRKVPPHIPAVATLKHIFSSCVDIRAIPKKIMLRALSAYCDDESDQQILQFLCSREGSNHYSEFIVEHKMSVIDLLRLFPSCHPSVECLIEYLPSLKPRFYSVASSPLDTRHSFKILFNVIEIKKACQCCEDRKGVCTSWFEKLSERIVKNNAEKHVDLAISDMADTISHLTLTTKDIFSLPKILVYKRKNTSFKLPDDAEIPVVMIGPGTGIAPFIGFLHHREWQKKNSLSGAKFGEMWLLYGCRYEGKDFLFREELKRLEKCNVLTNLLVCFSRDNGPDSQTSSRHVQDLIKIHSECLVELVDKGTIIYVCGDAKNMMKDVQFAFIEALKMAKNLNDCEAGALMDNLLKEGRYLTDVWI